MTNLPFSTNTAIKSAVAKKINFMNVSNIFIQKVLVIKFIIKIFLKLILSIKMWCRFVGVVYIYIYLHFLGGNPIDNLLPGINEYDGVLTK